MTFKSLKEVFEKPEERQTYLITGNIRFKVLNTDKQGNNIPSDWRTKFFNVPVPKMTLKHVKKLDVQAYAEEYVQITDTGSGTKALYDDASDVAFTPVSKTKLSSHRLGHKKHSIKMLENADGLNVNDGECVIDYIMYELADKHGFKKLTREKLIKFFGGKTATTDQIIAFAEQYETLSVFAIDPLQFVFKCHRAQDHNYSLCFMINNNHLYPILDKDTKKSIAMSNKISLGDYKFNVDYSDVQYIHKFSHKTIDSTDEDKDEDLSETQVGYGLDVTKKVILFREYFDNDYKEDHSIQKMMEKSMQNIDENGKSFIIDQIKFRNGEIVAYKDPYTDQVIESTTDYLERTEILEGLSTEFGSHVVKAQNQSYTGISNIIYDNLFGNRSKLSSNLSEKLFDIFDKNHIKPFCATISTDFIEDDNSCGFDVSKSYSAVLLQNETPFPIFQQFDEIQVFTSKSNFVPGEFYISKAIKFFTGMTYSRGWYPLNFVEFAIDRKCIKRSDITMFIPAKQFVKADVFKSFVEHIFTKYSEYDAKKLINYFIGDFGTKYIKSDKGCVTSSFEIACGLLIQYENTHNVSIDTLNEFHFVRAQTKTKKFNTGLPIHRQIVCGGIINLVKLHDSIVGPNSKIISLNTDSIMIKNAKDDIENMMTGNESTLEAIGMIRTEEWKIKAKLMFVFENRDLEIYQPNNWTIVNEGQDFTQFCELVDQSQSAVITGGGGTGKTEVIKRIRKDGDFIGTFTNKARENCITRIGEDNDIMTFDAFLNEHLTFDQKVQKMLKYTRIIIDEFTMLPVKFMDFLNFMSINHNIILLFFGDSNQLLQVDQNKIIYDYINTSTFNKMCKSNQFICSYKEQFSRFDIALKSESDYFIEHSKFQETLSEKVEKFTDDNICRSLKKKWEINQACSKRFRTNNPTNKSMKFILQREISSKQSKFDYTFTVGEHLMCNENLKDLKLFNGSICTLDDIVDGKLIVGENSFDPSNFMTIFDPNYCNTIYKYQGSCIKNDYTIHELNIMTKREIYTSITRGTKLSNVHFKFTAKIFVNEDVSIGREIDNIVSNDVDDKYLAGKIYKISFNGDIYIGSTIQLLEDRFSGHKSAKKGSDFIQKLKDNLSIAKIELIKDYPCTSQNQLVSEEKRICEEYIEAGKLNVLNTIFNRKKKIVNAKIQIDRLEKVNLEKSNEYHIIEDVKRNILRFHGKDTEGKTVDVSVTMNKKTKEQAMVLMQDKITKIMNESLKVKVGKCLIDWN